MKRISRAMIAWLCWAVACWGCAPAADEVPFVLRPDTRRIGLVVMDSSVLRQTTDLFRAAFPKEAALCFTGSVRDSVIEGSSWGVVRVTEVRLAVSDSTDEFHVYFPPTPRTGCAGPLVGISHDHTQLGYECAHSHPDAYVLFAEKRALFSIVFCADGNSEVLFQDGRRVPSRWAGEPN